MSETEREKAISLLLASFPVNETKAELKALLTAYDMALQGISTRNVGIGVRAFVQGRVPGHNPSFRPRPAELAAHIRPMQESDDRIAAAQRERTQQRLTNEFKHQLSAEERAAQVERMLARKVERAPIVKEPVHMAADKRAKPWHDKAELSASMERIRAYEETKGQPIPEVKPCTG